MSLRGKLRIDLGRISDLIKPFEPREIQDELRASACAVIGNNGENYTEEDKEE